jgi:hypothetical protein
VPVFDGHLVPGNESSDFLPLTPPSDTAQAKGSGISTSSVLNPLPCESFSENDLVTHIRSIEESTQATVMALGDVWQRRNELDASNIFSSFESGEASRYESATYDIYEVGKDGIPKPKQVVVEPAHSTLGDGEGDNRDASVWMLLRDINSNGKAIGRMT